MLRVALISDTHGLLRAEAVAFLRGCDHIIHGGDIGGRNILEELSSIAPLTAVRGNNDRGPWAEALPRTQLARFEKAFVYVIHDLAQLDLDPRASGISAVVSGHSHQPQIQQRDGVLYINPGSAGPRRFKLPVAVAELDIAGTSVTAHGVVLCATPTPNRRTS
jgi:putative phosphoesterase